MVEVLKDFEELCVLFNVHKVRFLVVGGYALAFHGAPRFTGDLDTLIQPSLANVERLFEALRAFGFRAHGVTPEGLIRERTILELGRQPVQIHVMTHVSGLSWKEAWDSRAAGFYGLARVNYLGREAFIRNKLAAGRTKDLADVEALRRSRSRRGSR